MSTEMVVSSAVPMVMVQRARPSASFDTIRIVSLPKSVEGARTNWLTVRFEFSVQEERHSFDLFPQR